MLTRPRQLALNMPKIFDKYEDHRSVFQASETATNHRWTTADPKRRVEILKLTWLGINIRQKDIQKDIQEDLSKKSD